MILGDGEVVTAAKWLVIVFNYLSPISPSPLPAVHHAGPYCKCMNVGTLL